MLHAPYGTSNSSAGAMPSPAPAGWPAASPLPNTMIGWKLPVSALAYYTLPGHVTQLPFWPYFPSTTPVVGTSAGAGSLDRSVIPAGVAPVTANAAAAVMASAALAAPLRAAAAAAATLQRLPQAPAAAATTTPATAAAAGASADGTQQVSGKKRPRPPSSKLDRDAAEQRTVVSSTRGAANAATATLTPLAEDKAVDDAGASASAGVGAAEAPPSSSSSSCSSASPVAPLLEPMPPKPHLLIGSGHDDDDDADDCNSSKAAPSAEWSTASKPFWAAPAAKRRKIADADEDEDEDGYGSSPHSADVHGATLLLKLASLSQLAAVAAAASSSDTDPSPGPHAVQGVTTRGRAAAAAGRSGGRRPASSVGFAPSPLAAAPPGSRSRNKQSAGAAAGAASSMPVLAPSTLVVASRPPRASKTAAASLLASAAAAGEDAVDVDIDASADDVGDDAHLFAAGVDAKGASRYRGVCKARSGHWRVQVGYRGRRLNVGHFAAGEEVAAARSYDCLLRILHGESIARNFATPVALSQLPREFAVGVCSALAAAAGIGWLEEEAPWDAEDAEVYAAWRTANHH